MMSSDREYLMGMREQLARYKANYLGVHECGTWGKPPRHYLHILPRDQYRLNIVGAIRERFWRVQPGRWSLHRYFHHLSSSQALAFNFFFSCYPVFPTRYRATAAVLGLPDAGGWDVNFEVILNPHEGTNIDVTISRSQGPRYLVEVKLTEAAFGSATNDPRHLAKLESVYRPLLAGRIAESCLIPRTFFANYQLFRNLAQLRDGKDDRLLLVLPRARQRLWRHAMDWCVREDLCGLQKHVRVVAVEDLLDTLAVDGADDAAGRGYLAELSRKYSFRPRPS